MYSTPCHDLCCLGKSSWNFATPSHKRNNTKAKPKSQAQMPSANAKHESQAQKPSAKAKASPASRLGMKLGQLELALHLKFNTRAMGAT